jgi:hypothetical protein
VPLHRVHSTHGQGTFSGAEGAEERHSLRAAVTERFGVSAGAVEHQGGDEVAAYVAELVAAAPPLTDEIRARLAALLDNS